ncbi:MAG TPA: hypothetical protein DCZ93_05545 [Elusimicrobia bacterium]|nr:hypothetical protein [Elusimicrobiota bacterium]
MEEKRNKKMSALPCTAGIREVNFGDILNRGVQLLEAEKSPKLTSAYFESPGFFENKSALCGSNKEKR